MQFRIGLQRIAAAFVSVLFGTWALTIRAVDWLGRLAVGDTYEQVTAKLPLWAHWLFTTPPWVPSVLAFVFAGFLFWLCWPRSKDEAGSTEVHQSKSGKLDEAISPALATGGSVRIRGNRTSGIGGDAGFVESNRIGSGGNVDIEGDDAFGMGGAGGNQGTADGRGGRRTLSPGEILGLPTAMWAYGSGGHGGSTTEYARRLNILTLFRREYFVTFPNDVIFIEAGIDSVPDRWINARLAETGEQWRVEMDKGGYKML